MKHENKPTASTGRRERKKQAVRDKICSETQRLISISGVDGTTVDSICECADIAKKTFYNYYRSKNDLLNDLCKINLLNHVDELINTALHEHTSLHDKLTCVFTGMKQHAADSDRFEDELLAFMVGNLSIDLRRGADQITHMNQSFLHLFKSSSEEIKPTLNIEFCAEMVVGMINALTLNRLHFPSYDSNKNFNRLLDYLLQSMLKNP